MSAARPYPDYVRAGDSLVVGVEVALGWKQSVLFGVSEPTPLSNPNGVDVSPELFTALQRHHVLPETMDFSRWSYYSGPLALHVGAITDFAHVADVADAVAQSLGELGYSTSDQAAAITGYVGDDITQAEAQKFGDAAKKLNPPPVNNPANYINSETIAQGLRDEEAAAKRAADAAKDAAGLGDFSWSTIALVAALVGVFVLVKK